MLGWGVHKQVLVVNAADMPPLCGVSCTQLLDLQHAWAGHCCAMTSFACATTSAFDWQKVGLIAAAAAAYLFGDGEGLAMGSKAAYVLPSVLPGVTLAAVCWVIVATNPLLSVAKMPSSNTLYMLWLCWLATYPCCPIMHN